MKNLWRLEDVVVEVYVLGGTEEGVTHWKHSKQRLSFGDRLGDGCASESLKREQRKALRLGHHGV